MQIDKIPLRSQLGRRIFGLFVLCALVPITLLAIISFWNVNRELREQNRRDLRQVSHEEGMSIYERLTFVEANIKAVAANLNMATVSPSEAGGLPSNLSHRFRGIEIASGNETYTLIFGELSSRFDLAPAELSYLRSGKSLVTT